MTDTAGFDVDLGLPPGVHPNDKSVPWTPDLDANNPVAPDQAMGLSSRTRKPWGTENEEALPVFQRSARDWTPGLVQVNSGASSLVVGRQPGRTVLSLWVPTSVMIGGVLTTTPAGVLIGSDPNEPGLLQTVLNVGDSLNLPTEASCYAAVIPGNSVGYVQFVTLTNPLGGELGVY